MNFTEITNSGSAESCYICLIEFASKEKIFAHEHPTLKNEKVCRIHKECLGQLIASGARKCSLCNADITSINGMLMQPEPQPARLTAIDLLSQNAANRVLQQNDPRPDPSTGEECDSYIMTPFGYSSMLMSASAIY